MTVLKRIPPDQLNACLAEAAGHPLSDPATSYPDWYLHRWHFLPEGYLSRRSISGYDHVIRRVYNVLHEERVIERVCRWLRELDARVVAEIGSGPGHALAAIAGTLPDASITGVDLSPYMLERAAATPALAAVSGVALRHGDSAALPFVDRTMDAIVAIHHLGHLPSRHAGNVIQEASRVLRAGGRLIVADHRWHPPVVAPGLILRRRARVARILDLAEFERLPD